MPARKTAGKTMPARTKEVEVVCKDEILSSEDDEMDTSTASSRRRSSRAPKPIQNKKSLKDASGSEEESEPESEEDSEVEAPKKKGRAPAKKANATGGVGKKANATAPARGKKRQLSPKKASNAKKAKKSKGDDDDDYSGTEEEEEDEDGERNGGDDDDDDADDTLDLEGIDDDVDDPNWTEPNYRDKEWLKANCLKCQFCEKTFDTTGNALKCFNSHKHILRCFVCFTVIKGKKNATKKLFKHYQLRHPKGDKASTVKCPHCDMSVAFKSVSCHIIAIHFREALGIPNPTPAQNGKATNGKSKANDSEDEDEDNESEEEEEEEEDD
ncbi:hypothetical protein Ocin01_03092 [Orchesella cincta]|uniref:Uncharacterized protein n=1 Tax=Orchesella cincta TaxID=48709 RepID=A0A1D2NEC3_ORCCI|nr:hypothetical protein Ocin01_03092 [Orchesella cincta]